MLLTTATIAAFKSFRKPVDVYFSDRTTILIGPNDHGKTNVLLAIDKLNPEREFPKTEINDHVKENDASHITYDLRLNDAEPHTISSGIRSLLEEELQSLQASSTDGNESAVGRTDEVSVNVQELVGGDRGGPATSGPVQTWWNQIQDQHRLVLVRTPGRPLEPHAQALQEATKAVLMSLLQPLLPKVFLFTSDVLRQLPDTVNLAALNVNEVMQGVFRLAGIWDTRERLLAGNTRQNGDHLREASQRLTTEIRKNWTQGKDLEFILDYVNNDIRLTVKDTAKTVTAVAERSDGFTAYFAMRMLLVARTDQATPNGYLFMFDEPGLNLHPKGQVDLQNVFEDIAHTNQIIYTTHSVFLINKNYPDRNHLIYKNEHGSNVDNKPFVGGWAKVKEHLGLYLSANFLFADKILLAEGATDELYLPSIFQGLIAHRHFNGDLNALAIRAGHNAKEMLGVASTYLAEERAVTALVDGDQEGAQRKRRIEDWAKRTKKECPVIILSDYHTGQGEVSIENFLEPTIFSEAVIAACKHVIDAGFLATPKEGWANELNTRIAAQDGKSLGKRVEDATKAVLGESISDVLIAIKYGELLQAAEAKQPEPPTLTEYWEGPSIRRLAYDLWKALGLPMRGDLSNIPLAG